MTTFNESPALQKLVHDRLDAATENGYFDEGEELHGKPNEYIAQDMLDHAVLSDDATIEEIIPHIQTWRETK